MTAIVVKPTQEEWQASRPDHINASEMGVITGASKYGSIVDLYNKKVNREVEHVENDAMLWGHVFEDGVAQIFAHKTGLEVIQSSRGDWQFIRQEEPWMACSPDRTYWLPNATKNARDWKSKGLLECKTTTQDPEAEGNEWMLQSWYAQVQWQLLVSEMEEAHLCCCVMGFNRKTIIRHWPANPEFQAKLYDICKDFWFNNVQAKAAPAPRTEEDVRMVFPESVSGKVVEADQSVYADVQELKALNANIKMLEERQQELRDRIAVAIGDADAITFDGAKLATYKGQITTRFDSKRFKEEHPDEYEQYAVKNSTRVLRLAK